MSKNLTTYSKVKSDNNRSVRGDFSFKKASLTLSDGKIFSGQQPTWQDGVFEGEVVFNTGMSGYVESLTDPSYAGQILTFTYPLIGNYGVNPDDGESDRLTLSKNPRSQSDSDRAKTFLSDRSVSNDTLREEKQFASGLNNFGDEGALGEVSPIQASGVVVSEAAMHYSHAGAKNSLLQWLKSQGVPIIFGVDTRALTKHLRTRGTMLGAISLAKVDPKSFKHEPKFVTIAGPQTYNTDYKKKVILIDCGAKANILRELLKLPLQVKRVPMDYDFSDEEYDGVLLSNGPGDPTDYKATVEIVKKILKGKKPVFGICLGSQIMGLAAGAGTYKLPFGHRGHNQPCQESNSQRCYITSQNHSYAVDDKKLPNGWRVWFRNLNDNSVEGIIHKSKPFFAVQFHPEAAPGPTDTNYLFDKFYGLIK